MSLKLTLDLAKDLYQKMLLIRRFEEKCVELYSAEKIRGFLHLYIGEEAVATGIMQVLDDDDAIISTYREHGQALLRGISAKEVMAELYGKAEGCTHGRGGSMHLFDVKKRFFGGYAIVGGGLPLAVGMALADKRMNRDRVTVCFFGDGAVAEGEFHEALNLAALWQLPVLFVCENNLYGMGTALKYAESETNLSLKAKSYNMSAQQVDGMDVMAVANAAEKSLKRIHAGKGPVFLECLTYRFRAHSMFDAELYRDKKEVEAWKKKGPLVTFKKILKDKGLWSKIDTKAIEEEINRTIDDAVAFAENGTWEDESDLEKFVYSPEEIQ
ncbi:MAG: pyruvate dehydrogenase (acetyl-transferring) E1 component subunit alpha [Sulfurospirillaceae bacterium]|nr:pyruvate dehydrogenase (acetyl-transferring) E1 component subunit alpha [Sulfurospirillaceae bacterium]